MVYGSGRDYPLTGQWQVLPCRHRWPAHIGAITGDRNGLTAACRDGCTGSGSADIRLVYTARWNVENPRWQGDRIIGAISHQKIGNMPGGTPGTYGGNDLQPFWQRQAGGGRPAVHRSAGSGSQGNSRRRRDQHRLLPAANGRGVLPGTADRIRFVQGCGQLRPLFRAGADQPMGWCGRDRILGGAGGMYEQTCFAHIEQLLGRQIEIGTDLPDPALRPVKTELLPGSGYFSVIRQGEILTPAVTPAAALPADHLAIGRAGLRPGNAQGRFIPQVIDFITLWIEALPVTAFQEQGLKSALTRGFFNTGADQ